MCNVDIIIFLTNEFQWPSVFQCQEMMWNTIYEYIDGLVQDCSNSSVLAMELLQSCTKPSMHTFIYIEWTVFVNVATKSAQHAHARMITTVAEKVQTHHLCDHGFMDVIKTPIVR